MGLYSIFPDAPIPERPAFFLMHGLLRLNVDRILCSHLCKVPVYTFTNEEEEEERGRPLFRLTGPDHPGGCVGGQPCVGGFRNQRSGAPQS